MFERLAGKLLNGFLSKYFVQNQEDQLSSPHKSAQLSVWSGYISLDHLEFRKDVVNELLQNTGVEMVSGSITSLEITVPWAKLGTSATSDDDGAVVVLVLDGVHVLLRTNYDYNDEALRKNAIASRRNALADSESYGRKETQSLSKLLQKRITEGILKDIMEKLHIHIRDVHVRLEDVVSDPMNPFAGGITLESIHIQAEDESYKEDCDGLDVIQKEGQLNHFAVYWNAIDYDESLPVEMSVLHVKNLSPMNLGKALNKCIARRGSALASPSRVGAAYYAPTHTYLLRPVDATCHAALSTKPGNLKERPSFVCSITIDDLSIHIRDFQAAGIIALTSAMKEHLFFKQYRPYRPPVSPLESPRAWWRYAAKVVRMELRESRMRWSWSRFHQRYEMRRRYCDLYERQCRYPSNLTLPRKESTGALESLSIRSIQVTDETDERDPASGPPNQGDDPKLDASASHFQAQRGLSQREVVELVEIEDGIRGDLSTRDIILYRAIVNARLAGIIGSVETTTTAKKKKRSRLRKWISSAAMEDAESERECGRLLAYLETASESAELSAEDRSRVALSIRVNLERGCMSLFAALESTSDQVQQYRRLHEQFMNISIQSFTSELDLMGNFESYQLTMSLDDFTISELRSSNKKECIVVSRVHSNGDMDSNDGMDIPSNPLISVQIMSDPPDHPEYDIGFHACVDAVEVNLTPDSEWMYRIRDLIPSKGEISSSKYWQNVSLSQLGSDRAGWLGRSARALSEHKNLDLDVRINCPVICFHGDRECTLMIDLGTAHLATESLAGVALAKLNYAFKDTKPEERGSAATASQQSSRRRSRQVTSTTERTDGSVGDGNSLFLAPSMDGQTIMTFPSSPKFGADHFFLNGAASVAGSEARRFTVRSTVSEYNGDRTMADQSGHTSFYDKFQIHLSRTRIYLLEPREDRRDDVLSDFDLVVSLSSSVIPSDLTRCRFKAQALVNDIALSASRWSVHEIGKIANAWKRSVSRASQSRSPDMFVWRGDERSRNLHDELMSEIKSEAKPLHEEFSETSSVVDENEFLDVFEDDGETSWSDDKWTVDAETVLNGDDQSQKSAQKRRRARSCSDVSSTSGGSRKRAPKRAGSVYLNAENLARLEEGRGEEDEDSDLDSDADSFHSAISFGGRIELVSTLVEDIAMAENEVAALEERLLELSNANVFSFESMQPHLTRSKRRERRSLKVSLDRAKAELRAMKASLHDLEKTVEIDVTDEYSDAFTHESKHPHAEGREHEEMAAVRAKSILRFRRQRSALIENMEADNPTDVNPFNREFFQGSIVVKSFFAKLESGSRPDESSTYDFQLSHVSCALLHRSRDSKVFIGADLLCLSHVQDDRRRELLRAGGPTCARIFSRLASPEVDPFLRLAVDLIRHGRQRLSLKGRIILGGIEVSPEASLFPAVTKLVHATTRNAESAHQGEVTQPKPNFFSDVVNVLTSPRSVGNVSSLVHDLHLRCSSLRMCVWDDHSSLPLVGAIVLTDAGVRTSLEVAPMTTRLQVDIICGNVQVYGCTDDVGSPPQEFLGRKDHHGQVLRTRFRIGCTPRSQVDGWAVGHGRSEIQEEQITTTPQDMAVDCHVGIRVQPIQLVPYNECLQRCLGLLKDTPGSKGPKRPSKALRLRRNVAVRWRVDVAVQKTTVLVPSTRGDIIDVAKMPDSALQLMLSLRLCAEHRSTENHHLPVIRASLYDVSVVRSLDGWPILERSALSMAAVLSDLSSNMEPASLLEGFDLPPTSYWSETEMLLPECRAFVGSSYNSTGTTDGLKLQISFLSSPIRLNASSSILILLLNTHASYKKIFNLPAENGSNVVRKEPRNLSIEIIGVFESPDFEVKFFKDSLSAARAGIAFARPLFSIAISGWLVEVSGTGEDCSASMRVCNFMVHDLSMHPGVRAVGLNQKKGKQGSDAFLTLQVSLRRQEALLMLEMRLIWGEIQLLPLPTLIDSCLSIVKDIWQMDAPKMTPLPTHVQKSVAWPRETVLIHLTFQTEGFECILSSRNIFDHVRDSSEESINVVAFRWASTLKGFIALVRSSGPSTMEFTSTANMIGTSKMQDHAKVIETIQRFSENQLHTLEFLKSQEDDTTLAHTTQRGVISIQLDLKVTEFQALRTCVERAKATMSAAGDSGDAPAVFTVVPPTAGEQRITNPINFSVEHRLFGTSVSSSQHGEPMDDMELAHAFELKADRVDVLVYIRSSAGGMGDAHRITLAPIVSSLKDAQRAYQKINTGDGKFGKTLMALIKRASTVGSATVKGFQVTLVPGGATRLTESPIVQFVMKNARVGVAAIDVPAIFEQQSPRGATLLAISGALRGESSGKEFFQPGQARVSHVNVGGWLNVDISAHYHNRRLVAWEPLIEQWTIGANFGVDLVRVLDVTPSLRDDSTLGAPAKGRSTSAMNFVPDAGETLRDIRKLFGSPFANKQSDRGAENVKCASDMPYLLLVALAPSLITAALLPSASNELNIQQDATHRSVMQIPGTRRMEWLKQFGHPGFAGGEKTPLSRDPAIQCCLRDTKTLNINFTGALIENLATYMTGTSNTGAIIPHWIRNETGLTIRFMEVLDSDRVRKGEQPKPTILASGREIPLSLRRAISQSCDPHRAQITLELGSFEETVDRVDHSKYNVSKGSRSTTFFYKAFGRIQVDAVGLQDVSFYENTELLSQNVHKRTAAVGKIIVRISLKGGIKLVSIESPMVMCNATEQDLHCEVRDRNGIVQLWSSTIPMISEIDDENDRIWGTDPVPADLLPLIDSASATLSLTALAGRSQPLSNNEALSPVCAVVPPLPYSRSSISRGLVAETELSLLAILSDETRLFFLSACSLRLGSFEVASASRTRANSRKPTASIVPEQRMLFLRAPLVVVNQLPALMHVQVRRKVQCPRSVHVSSSNLVGLANGSSSSLAGLVAPMEKAMESWDRHIDEENWTDLGIVSCGKSVRWTGAQASQEVEIKVKLLDVRDKSSEQFPDWSTVATILPQKTSRRDRDAGEASSTMTVNDEAGTPLALSVQVRAGLGVNENDDFGQEDIRSFASLLDQAHRVVRVSVPYWIVDSSGLDLEFLSNKPIAGQAMRALPKSGFQSGKVEPWSCLGLADLVRNEQFDDDSARLSFEVLMIGQERASRLTMRQRQTRFHQDNRGMSQYTSSWCEPFSLQTTENTFNEVTVFPPSGFPDQDGPHSSILEPLALRYEVVKAPSKCGGLNGTKIIHIFSRYKIINEMGRDIEIIAGHGQKEPITIEATGNQVPFHFDDSDPIRFRPKEFGWLWSGKISTVKKRREVTVRLVHKLRGQIIVATVECLTTSKSPANILVFRNATQPPFRLENHTMYAFRYGQSSKFHIGREKLSWQGTDLSLDSTLLPYQHVDFAWDEPDEGRRSISIEFEERGSTGRTASNTLGTVALEKIAPGSNVHLSSSVIVGEIVADGPTRVLRLTDANMPESFFDDDTIHTDAMSSKDGALTIPSSIEVRLFHGIGISVVDWTPKELLYISIDNIIIERTVDQAHERFSVTVGHLSIDNQLWVTPYPVLLKIGRKQAAGRRRRNHAFEFGWTRALANQGGLMLLTNVELSIDPITLRVDGAVVNHLVNMILHPITDKQSNAPRGDNWLEAEIRRVLRIDYFSERTNSQFPQLLPNHLADAGKTFLATAAAAAKIKAGSGLLRLPAAGTRLEPQKEGSHRRLGDRKLHINKVKISSVKTEISWTGALPKSFFGLPGILRPALTFESLPVVLRSFTSNHVYGTAQDIAEGIGHHYISVWRVFDTVFGLAFKPTFLIRAFVYTTREAFASFFDAASLWCSLAEDVWLDNIPKDVITKSTTTAPSLRKGFSDQATGVSIALLRKPILLMASSCRTWGLVFSSFASSLRYREPDGILASRTRNPRLFAHVDGKELLVEYVEGENAGKALLSRVRAGQHLGEGYVFHAENVHLRSNSKGDTQADVNTTPLIIMVTSERVLLLNGERNANFCHVIWEALFDNMVNLELEDVDGAFFCLAKFWYLVDTEHSKGNVDESFSRFANAIVTDSDLGLGMLMCKSLFVPQDLAKTLRRKITSVHKSMEDALSLGSPQSLVDMQRSFSDKI